MSSPLPAHETKHISQLQYPFRTSIFHLTQLDNGLTNGTGLWLGAQCLSLFLADIYGRTVLRSTRPRAIELGSGIGLSALALCSLGWDVLATDLPVVISSVLSHNISHNSLSLPPGSGSIQVRALDWTVPPENWSWDSNVTIASHTTIPPESIQQLRHEEDQTHLAPPFDLIISADTLYLSSLADPLLRSLHALSVQSIQASSSNRPPPIYLCVERRDPILMDRTLSDANHVWNFTVERVPHKKVAKAMQKGGIRWPKHEWEGIELWKLSLRVTQ